ncbi:MAG: dipeptidase [Actinomycetota bacterium]
MSGHDGKLSAGPTIALPDVSPLSRVAVDGRWERQRRMNPYGLPVVDSHLDLAYNVLAGRDLTLTAHEIRARENVTEKQAMVTFPEMKLGGIALAFSTLFIYPKEFVEDLPTYDPPAPDQAMKQIEIYLRWEDEGRVRIIRGRSDLDSHLRTWQSDHKPALLFLMEGADPIERPEDLEKWWKRGLRILGPAWSRTRYAGGSSRPAGLSVEGRELVTAMRELGIVLDASHLAEEAFWEAVEIGVPRVVASHSNSRAIVSSDRQLTDDMIRSIGDHDGIVGLVLFNGFIAPGWERGSDPPPLAALSAHADRVAGLIGWERLGIGSDLDGGMGREESPLELDTIADLWKVGDLAPEASREGVLGGNWLRFLADALPK